MSTRAGAGQLGVQRRSPARLGWRMAVTAMVAGLCALIPAVPVLATTTPSGTMFPVTRYGAHCNGTGNDFSGIQRALDAAAKGSANTVTVPGGTSAAAPAVCLVAGHLQMRGPHAVTLTGVSRDLSTLRQTGGSDLLGAKFDGSIVENLTLDSRTVSSSGTAFGSGANNTQLLHTRVLGSPSHFTVYYTGRAYTQPATGNVVNDVIDVDQKCDDGFSYSFQTNGSITNLNETGTRLAIYEDSNIVVTGMTYTPGPCPMGDGGYYITPPSNNITVSGFTSSGKGGVIGFPDKRGSNSNITIDHETLTNPAGYLDVFDVTGLVIQNSNFGSEENVVFEPRAGGTFGTYTSSTPTTVDCNPINASTVNVTGITCST